MNARIWRVVSAGLLTRSETKTTATIDDIEDANEWLDLEEEANELRKPRG